MSNWKIKFALIFAFNAKLNGYLSYILPLQFTQTNVEITAFSLKKHVSLILLTNAFFLNTGRFDVAW